MTSANNIFQADTLDVNLAQIPFEKGHPGCYGEAGSSGRYLSDGTAHVVIAELMAGSLSLSQKILILLPSKDAGAITTGGRFLVIDDTERIFPELPIDNSKLFTVEKA